MGVQEDTIARPKGIPNRPGGKKPGRKPKATVLERQIIHPDEQKRIKQAILELIEAEEADNLTEAAELLGYSKLQIYAWTYHDKEWYELIQQAQQIKADRLEADLDKMNNPVARIFRLKKLRPEYRDTYKFNVTSEPLIKLLEELKSLGESKEQPKLES